MTAVIVVVLGAGSPRIVFGCGAAQLPADVALVYEWREGSVPPPSVLSG